MDLHRRDAPWPGNKPGLTFAILRPRYGYEKGGRTGAKPFGRWSRKRGGGWRAWRRRGLGGGKKRGGEGRWWIPRGGPYGSRFKQQVARGEKAWGAKGAGRPRCLLGKKEKIVSYGWVFSAFFVLASERIFLGGFGGASKTGGGGGGPGSPLPVSWGPVRLGEGQRGKKPRQPNPEGGS